MTLTDRLIPNTTTTGVPTFTIEVDGNAISRQFNVLSIVVCREVNKIPFARITLIDGDAPSQTFPASDDEVFVPGNEIELFLGYHAQEESVFKGIITSQYIKVRRGGSQLTVEAKDPAVKMTIGRKNRYFAEQADSAAIEEILGEYSLEPDVEATEVEHQELVQYDMTDWDFILSRAEANGKVVLVEDGKVTIKAPAIESEAGLEVQFGASIEELDAEIDSRFLYTGVKAFAWDQANQERIEAEGADPGLEEQGNLSASTLAEVIGLEFFNLYHSGKVAQDELQAWADAQLLKSRLSKIRGRVKYQGYSPFTIGGTLLLTGIGERMSGNTYVSGIRHELNAGNWYTDAQFGLSPDFFTQTTPLPAPRAGGLLAPINGLQIGIVTQLEEDPEGEERIKVKLPIINPDDEGVWARLATLDAGDSRGILFRPEVDDEVIIGFVNDDPRDPVVLGMLHSSAKPSPISATADNHEKGFVTRSEMKFIFNDDESSMLLETPGGNKVLISDDAEGITLEDQNGNKIVLDSNGITLESAADLILKTGSGDVKVEGVNIEHKAQAEFKAEGSAGLEVSTSAIAVVKGSLVQIN